MFTGDCTGAPQNWCRLTRNQIFVRMWVELPDHMLDGLKQVLPWRITVAALTVTEINGNHVSFDLMKETLRITNLGDLKVGIG